MEKVANAKREIVNKMLAELGKYTVDVYLCKDGENVKLSEANHGHFF